MKLYKNMEKIVVIVIETHYYHMSMNTLYLMWIQPIKRKHELSKIRFKKINFINRLKYAEHNFFCICVDVYKNYEGNDYDKKTKFYQH